jgi:RNA polymerase sigma factor for flagellar operon FliA
VESSQSRKAFELDRAWTRYTDHGDPRAREQLILAYSPLVKYVAGRLGAGLPAHVEDQDLISHGMVGLIAAIERYDYRRHTKFETFAIPRIRGAILDELRSLDWVPRSVRARTRQIEQANTALERELHRAPTDDEMARRLSVTVDELRRRLTDLGTSALLALDELWAVSVAPSSDPLSDQVSEAQVADPARTLDVATLKHYLAAAIARLPEREKLVIALHYYEELTLAEIADVLGVSQTRVSQLHAKAVLRLRSALDAAGLSDFG